MASGKGCRQPGFFFFTWASGITFGEQELRFWRTYTGIEVDFVIGSSHAIEVKAPTRVTDRHCKGLRAHAYAYGSQLHAFSCQGMRPVNQSRTSNCNTAIITLYESA